MDAGLGLDVEAPGEAGQARVVVRHLDRDVEPDLAPVVIVVALEVELEVAAAVTAAPGDEQAAVDAPADDPAAAVHLVFGRAEGEQAQLGEEQDHGALGLGVADAHQAEAEAPQRAPVGAGGALEVLGSEGERGGRRCGGRYGAGLGVEGRLVGGRVQDRAGDRPRPPRPPGHEAMLATPRSGPARPGSPRPVRLSRPSSPDAGSSSPGVAGRPRGRGVRPGRAVRLPLRGSRRRPRLRPPPGPRSACRRRCRGTLP